MRSTDQIFSRTMGGDGAKRHANVNEGLVSGIVDRESFDDRNIVLCGGEIDLAHHLVVKGHGFRVWLLVESSASIVAVCHFAPRRRPVWSDIPIGRPRILDLPP